MKLLWNGVYCEECYLIRPDWILSVVLSGYNNDARLQEAMRLDASRKGSVVNVNPVNTRPQNDTPEIRKYKKRFNSEILCAALWGEYVTNPEPQDQTDHQSNCKYNTTIKGVKALWYWYASAHKRCSLVTSELSLQQDLLLAVKEVRFSLRLQQHTTDLITLKSQKNLSCVYLNERFKLNYSTQRNARLTDPDLFTPLSLLLYIS